MKTILSIQSHVAYGYVGNKAAVFPLQLMGFDVITINTVQFSNHTGYGSWTGQIFTDNHIADVLSGLEDRGIFPKIDAVLSGYLGDASLGHIITDTVQKIRVHNKDIIYCCDPVMGDIGRGLFVRDDIPSFFNEDALPCADIITPNLYELELLSGITITDIESVKKACNILHDLGPKIILLTSLHTEDSAENEISMFLSEKGKDRLITTTPKLDFETPPNGSGDLTAALFTGHYMNTNSVKVALSKTASTIYNIMKDTYESGERELALIPSQHHITRPQSGRFEPQPI